MQSERWRSCTDIFHAALELPPNERNAFIERSCAGDESLRRKTELLLRYHDEAGAFISSPAFAASPELLAEDPDALLGQHLGCYRIDAVLGVGGMGVVYLACDERLGRKVGLKLLPRAFVTDEAQLARLKHEARTASALNHPNIVTVHEIGQVDSTHYIAIEFIEGVTLRERITHGPIPPDEALEIATQAASALCVAHRARIVHRDIKPENIMIRPDGYVKVLDFGIAKSAQSDIVGDAAAMLSEIQTRTRLGVVLGTTRYMSPEQLRAETVDARSDIWSLGVVLHEMLTGGAPFNGDTPEKVKSAVLLQDAPPLDPTSISTELTWIVGKCLRKDRTERFQSSEQLLHALRANAPGSRGRGGRIKIVALLATSLLLAAAVAMLVRHSNREPKSANNAALVLTKPTGVAIAPSGIIYLADFPNHTIRVVARDGAMRDFAGTRGNPGSANGLGTVARFANPADIDIGPDGALYVADCDNHVIRKITPARVVSTFAGQPGRGGHKDGPANSANFKFPTGLAVDRAGNVYVADIANNVVRKISADGIVTTLAGTPGQTGTEDGIGPNARFNQVHGVAVDRDGNVYAADFGNHTIRKITPAGAVTTIAGQAGTPGSNDGTGSSAHFCAPYSVAADDAGNVYVADTSNHTIRKITAKGAVSTIAGLAGNVGNRDGPGHLARFAIPAAVKVDASGNVYVADFGNHSIRKVTSAGVVETVTRHDAN